MALLANPNSFMNEVFHTIAPLTVDIAKYYPNVSACEIRLVNKEFMVVGESIRREAINNYKPSILNIYLTDEQIIKEDMVNIYSYLASKSIVYIHFYYTNTNEVFGLSYLTSSDIQVMVF